MSTRRGFTLVETLIVVVVVALLASVVLPAMQSAGSQPLEAAVRNLASDLRLARSLAMQYNTNYTVQFDVPKQSYEIIHTGAGTPPPLQNPLAPGGTQDGTYRVSLNPTRFSNFGQSSVRLRGVQLETTGASVNDVTFGPLGGTGPQRNEDTGIWLVNASTTSDTGFRIRVSWVTGQVWSAPADTTPTPPPTPPTPTPPTPMTSAPTSPTLNHQLTHA